MTPPSPLPGTLCSSTGARGATSMAGCSLKGSCQRCTDWVALAARCRWLIQMVARTHTQTNRRWGARMFRAGLANRATEVAGSQTPAGPALPSAIGGCAKEEHSVRTRRQTMSPSFARAGSFSRSGPHPRTRALVACSTAASSQRTQTFITCSPPPRRRWGSSLRRCLKTLLLPWRTQLPSTSGSRRSPPCISRLGSSRSTRTGWGLRST
mmetsp:Transcript_39300/g.91867  ORF Transcript_39300/g.91867 Transcript_39300/m.91867 type:complete len:210 (+) Transcript_39300:499-1128(+)